MEYLYVCAFSNGHIKVGRSIEPWSRIANHADRVACLGVELADQHIVNCVDSASHSEYELIQRCVSAASKRNKSEWFEGLSFMDVCAWANECAALVPSPSSGIARALSAHGNSCTELARSIGRGVTRQNVEYWVAAGRVPFERCADVAYATGYSLEELNDGMDWAPLRNFIEKA